MSAAPKGRPLSKAETARRMDFVQRAAVIITQRLEFAGEQERSLGFDRLIELKTQFPDLKLTIEFDVNKI